MFSEKSCFETCYTPLKTFVKKFVFNKNLYVTIVIVITNIAFIIVNHPCMYASRTFCANISHTFLE